MNDIQNFMQMAVADQIATAGEQVIITRSKDANVRITCMAVITSRDGSYDAVVGRGGIWSFWARPDSKKQCFWGCSESWRPPGTGNRRKMGAHEYYKFK